MRKLFPSSLSLGFCGALALAFISPRSTYGDTHYWTGNTSSLWSNAGNWQSNNVPSANESAPIILVFPPAATRVNTTNDLAGSRPGSSFSVDGIQINGTGYMLGGIGSGSTLIIRSNIAVTAANNAISQSLDLVIENQNLEVSVNAGLTLTISSILQGTNGINKSGSGTLLLNGQNGNSFTGTTMVNGGKLQLGKSVLGFGLTAIPGPLQIGNPAGTSGSEVVQLLADNQITDAGPVTVRYTGVLDLNQHTERLDNLVIENGSVVSVAGNLILGGAVSVPLSGTFLNSISGVVSLNGGNRTLSVASTAVLQFPANISDGTGSGGLIIDGLGNVSLSGSNSFSGPVQINAGAGVVVGSTNALGSSSAGTTVASGGVLFLPAIPVIAEPLTISGTGRGNGAFQFSGTNLWSGNMVFPAPTAFAPQLPNSQLSFSNVISGAGGLVTTNGGTYVFLGSLANTYSGATYLAGNANYHLQKWNGVGVTAIPGSMFIGSDDLNADVVTVNFANQIADTSAVTIYPSGGLVLAASDAIGSLVIQGGYAISSPGVLTVNGNITAPQTWITTSYVYGNLSLGNAMRDVDVALGITLNFVGSVSESGGSAGIHKTGAGNLVLINSNSFSGAITIDAGKLVGNNGSSFGPPGSGLTVAAGATLELGGATFLGKPLTLSGAGENGFNALQGFGTNYWTGPITLASDSYIFSDTNVAFNFSGGISGPGSFIKVGAGTVQFSGTSDNLFVGALDVRAGKLNLFKTGGATAVPGTLVIGDTISAANSAQVFLFGNNQIANNATIKIRKSGKLDLNNFSDAVGSLDFTGGNISSGSGTLTLSGNVSSAVGGGTASIAGTLSLGGVTRIFNVDSPLQISANIIDGGASAGLTHTGTGALYLQSSNSFSGPITISDGLLLATDDHALGSTTAGTTVDFGATLALTGVDIGMESLTLHGSSALFGYNANSWAGPVTLAADSGINLQSGDSLIITGTIGGPGKLSLFSEGYLQLAGSTPNTFTGGISVDGTLELAKPNLVSALGGGSISIGNTNDPAESDLLILQAAQQFPPNTPVNILTSGHFNLNGNNQTVGLLNLYASSVETGIGTLILNSNVMQNIGNSGAQLSGNVSLNGTNRTFTVLTNANLDMWATISSGGNNAGFMKDGPGSLSLLASNSYSGVTTLNEGSVLLWNSKALGSTSAGTTVSAGAVLSLVDGVNITNEGMTISGSGPAGGALVIYGTNTWTGNIVLANDAWFDSHYQDSRLNLTGLITGFGGVVKNGAGTLQLSGSFANTYLSNTVVRAGSLELNKSSSNAVPAGLDIGTVTLGSVRLLGSNQISDVSRVTLGLGGTLDCNNLSETIGSLEGAGNVLLGTGVLTCGQNNLSTTLTGSFSGNANPAQSQLIKTGTGSMTLTGASLFTGETILLSGKYIQNGSQGGKITLLSGSTLGGTGTVGQVVCTGGLVSPGNSPGKLNTGNFSCATNSTFFIELNGTSAGTNYDQVNVTGSVTLGGSLLVNAGFNSTVSNQFTIIRNDGIDAVTGTFSNLTEGAIFFASSRQFKISYAGGDGNDVVLTQVSPIFSPKFSSITAPANGQSMIQGLGLSNLLYGIEASTNLTTWTPIGFASSDNNGSFQYSDTNAANFPVRFYRVVAP